MTKMNEDEKKAILEKNPHLKTYIDSIRKKIGEPTFYSLLPRDLKNEKNPNIIYTTKGIVFVHIFKTPDMDEIEYRAIEPLLNDVEQVKHEELLKLIVKKAPEKDSAITDEDLKKNL